MNMIRKLFIIAAITMAGITCENMLAQEHSITPDGTYLFVQRDTCDLFMDVYNPAEGSEDTFMGVRKPTVVFMFGGGFIHGTRDNADYGRKSLVLHYEMSGNIRQSYCFCCSRIQHRPFTAGGLRLGKTDRVISVTYYLQYSYRSHTQLAVPSKKSIWRDQDRV